MALQNLIFSTAREIAYSRAETLEGFTANLSDIEILRLLLIDSNYDYGKLLVTTVLERLDTNISVQDFIQFFVELEGTNKFLLTGPNEIKNFWELCMGKSILLNKTEAVHFFGGASNKPEAVDLMVRNIQYDNDTVQGQIDQHTLKILKDLKNSAIESMEADYDVPMSEAPANLDFNNINQLSQYLQNVLGNNYNENQAYQLLNTLQQVDTAIEYFKSFF